MIKVLLILFLAISADGASTLLSILQQVETNLITKICTDIKNNPTAASNTFQNLEEAISKGCLGKQLPLSVQYIDQQSIQVLLGEISCPSFFAGLQTAFQADLQDDESNIGNVLQQFSQCVIGVAV